MKPVYTARHVTDAHLIRGYLESIGIAAIVRGEFLVGAVGELPADLCKVWVLDHSDFEGAQRALQAFLQGEAARTHANEPWRCTRCGEMLEGQFTDCWHCGTARDNTTD